MASRFFAIIFGSIIFWVNLYEMCFIQLVTYKQKVPKGSTSIHRGFVLTIENWQDLSIRVCLTFFPRTSGTTTYHWTAKNYIS